MHKKLIRKNLKNTIKVNWPETIYAKPDADDQMMKKTTKNTLSIESSTCVVKEKKKKIQVIQH